MAELDFNAQEVEITNYEAIPAGKYQAVITDSEMKETKSGTGRYLQLTFEVIEGDYRGRKLWERINLLNPNQTAVRIAKETLAKICLAVNVPVLKDTVELHNLPLTVEVKLKTDADGEVRNEIKGYSPRMNYAAPQPASPAAAAKTAGKAPWKQQDYK